MRLLYKEKKIKKSIRVLRVGVVLFVGGLVFGLGGTIIGMIRSFNSSVGQSGTALPEQLAGNISNALISTAIGIPVSFIGLCLVIGGLIAYFMGRRQRAYEKQEL